MDRGPRGDSEIEHCFENKDCRIIKQQPTGSLQNASLEKAISGFDDKPFSIRTLFRTIIGAQASTRIGSSLARIFQFIQSYHYPSRFNLVAFEAFDDVVPVALTVPFFPQSGTFNTSPTFIKSGFFTWGLTANKLGNVMPNFSFAIIIMVSPATTLMVEAVPFEQVAVGSASGEAAGATHAEFGILITSPTLMRRGLVIWVLANCSWETVVLVDVAMFARLSPATTVRLDTMLQLLPIAAVLFAPRTRVKNTVERRGWNCIMEMLIEGSNEPGVWVLNEGSRAGTLESMRHIIANFITEE
jgi:hypothetical protein